MRVRAIARWRGIRILRPSRPFRVIGSPIGAIPVTHRLALFLQRLGSIPSLGGRVWTRGLEAREYTIPVDHQSIGVSVAKVSIWFVELPFWSSAASRRKSAANGYRIMARGKSPRVL